MTASEFRLDRRRLLSGVAVAAIGLGGAWPDFLHAQAPERSIDHTIRIAPVSLEIAPGKIDQDDRIQRDHPGPALRLREGKPGHHQRHQRCWLSESVHWHGLYVPAVQDGAMEESPVIPGGQSHTYTFTPKPAGTRWYHSHAMAKTDLTRSTYRGSSAFYRRAEDKRPRALRPRGMFVAHRWEPSGSACRIAQRAAGRQRPGGHVSCGDVRPADARPRRADPRAAR